MFRGRVTQRFGVRALMGICAVAAGAALFGDAEAVTTRHSAEFQTPSRNIRCLANPTTGWLRCWVISDAVSYEVKQRGRATRRPASDAPDAVAPVVPYGSTWQASVFSCASRATGLRCWSRTSSCCFVLARGSHRTFCGRQPPPPPPCDPSYPGVCIPSPPPDLDCVDVPHTNIRVVGRDPHGFDGWDNDGVGCET